MEQIVEKITQDLLQKIPDEIQSITPDELLSAGVPYVVVETIRKNIESTIDSELNLSESEWVQISNEPVQRAWQNFIRVSKEHLNIPKEKLSYLLTEAVEQCLELAVKPRQSVPEIIFRTRETIDLLSVKERVDSIQVNKQLGLALLRYMQKKEVEEISFDQAHHLIKKVDERLIEDYHPLKWAQALKPVFDLAGPAVDAELFRIYFEEKEKPAYARKFDQMDEPLNESEFIEALSSADVLDVEDYDTLQSEPPIPADKETEPEKVVEIDETDEKEKVVNNDDEVVLEEPAEERDHNEIVVEDKDSDSEDVEDQEEETIFEKEQPEEFEEPEYEQQESFEVEDSEDELSDEEEEDQKENIVDLFSKIREVDHIESDNDSKPVISLVEDEDDDEDEEAEDNITLLSKFMFDESDEGNPDSEVVEEESESEEKIPEKEPTSIYDEMNLVQDDRANRQKNMVNPENSLATDQLEAVVYKAIDDLAEDLKVAVTLREFEGLSYEEIADVMECPVGTVRSRIFRAREAIEKKIAGIEKG